MKTIIHILTAAALIMPMAGQADTCADLAKVAMRNGGNWQAVAPLKPGARGEDGPWEGAALREESGTKASGFLPHYQADRERLLAEARQKDPDVLPVVDAYLSPSSKAFDQTLDAFGEKLSLNGNPAMAVHRWPGTNVFAVSMHDTSWYDCQAAIALFYTDKSGKLHVASADGLSDCAENPSGESEARPVLINGQFGFMDEMWYDDAVSSSSDRWQVLHQGDHLSASCGLTYYHDIGYRLVIRPNG